MQWLYLLFFLECGMVPIETPPMMPNVQQYYYTQFGTDVVLLEHLILGGDTRCFFAPIEGSLQFVPAVMEYTVRAAVVFGPLEIGGRHQCNHHRNYLDTLSGYTEFYIRLSSPPRIQPGN